MSNSQADRVTENNLRSMRRERGLSQHQLAARAGLSRTEVSAIENGRVSPSVYAALALGDALGCPVESLFSSPTPVNTIRWGESPPDEPCRVWLTLDPAGAMVAHRVERTHMGTQAHDALWDGQEWHINPAAAPEKTLVLAGCDPAVSLLAGPAAERGIRLIPLIRSSLKALNMLRAGTVHAAGFHLGGHTARKDNCTIAREALGEGYRLTRVTRWHEGLALADGIEARTPGDVFGRQLRWVSREPGSGAQAGLDRLLSEYAAHHYAPGRVATDHYGVAHSVALGWADVGPCTRLVAEQSGLSFLFTGHADYDLCWATAMDDDVRLQALSRIVRSREVREALGTLPGYETRCTGDTAVLASA